jgi:hypothetical protein
LNQLRTKILEFDPDTNKDYEMLSAWWTGHGMTPPEKKVIPWTTYIMYYDDVPVISLSLIITNTPVGWLDNFVANPEYKNRVIRRECAQILVRAVEYEAETFGCDRTFCMAVEPELNRYYESLGYKTTCASMHTMIKEL